MGTKFLRLLIIVGILAGTFSLGKLLYPHSVGADVFQIVATERTLPLDFLNLQAQAGGKRLVTLNGNVLHTEISRSAKKPTELLDDIEKKLDYNGKYQSTGTTQIADLMLPLSRPFRVKAKHWQMLGQLFDGTSKAPMELLQKIATDQDLGRDAAGGFVVLAFNSPTATETVVWTIRFDEQFNPLRFAGSPEQDVKGWDIPQIERFPGSRRTLSLTEDSDVSKAHVVAYDGHGTIDDHISHYALQCQIAGMKEVYRNIVSENEALLQFNGNGKEFAIFFTRSSQDQYSILDMIQMRKTS